jgi:hypothetical protein
VEVFRTGASADDQAGVAGKEVTRLAILAALLLTVAAPVRAEQPTLITLSCSGTQKFITTDDPPNPVVDIGFVVDLNGRTVAFASHHVPVSGLDSTRIDFKGVEAMNLSDRSSPKHVTIVGFIDRVTGSANVTFIYELQPVPTTKTVFNDAEWKMSCRPATRQF